MLVSICSVGNSWETFRKAMTSSGRAYRMLASQKFAASNPLLCYNNDVSSIWIMRCTDSSVLGCTYCCAVVHGYRYYIGNRNNKHQHYANIRYGKVKMTHVAQKTGDEIASCVLETFHKLSAKRKPLQRPDGSREWVPLSGIVLAKGSDFFLSRLFFLCTE